jgi:hypothetical protein
MSDDAVKQAVVHYKACPEKQKDDLAVMVGTAIGMAQGTVLGVNFTGRSGDTATVEVAYSEQGQRKVTTFDYHQDTKTVSAKDAVAQGSLDALKAECG